MERIQQEQSKVRQKSGQTGMTWKGWQSAEDPKWPLLPFESASGQEAGSLEAATGSGPTEEVRLRGGVEGLPLRLATHLPVWCKAPACILSLQAQLTDLSEQRAKVLRLQAELETSEQVQRDFVRLSQALQVWHVPSPPGCHDSR